MDTYNITPLISTPTPLSQQPEAANNQRTWTYAASSILPKISITEKNRLQWAILDSGASSHFLLADAPCVNRTPATSPITVHLPNGQTVSSSHTCELDLPNLPQQARLAHILPGLANRSLISMVKLCNAGCKVNVTDISCEVIVRGKPPIKCHKCATTGLWMMPLTATPETPPPSVSDDQDSIAFAFHAHETSTQSELAQYHHQSLFSPPTVTVLNAVKNQQLDSFPGMTEALLKHLPPSTGTAKGHMHQTRSNVRSTRSNTQDVKDARLDLQDMNPTQEACSAQDRNLFCYAALADAKSGVIYTDLPGRFPVASIRNMQYIFVCYAYEPNAILVRPMKNRENESMVAAYKDIYEYLTSKNFKPKLNVTDNECSKAVQSYIASQDVDWQLVEPNDHRVNAAERAI